jgi:hypothetical protein
MTILRELEDIRVEEQDLSSADMVLEADTGESLQIMARGVTGANADDIVLESVDEETMLAYPVEDGGAELFPSEALDNVNMDLLGLMRSKGFTAPMIEVPEGDEYRLSNNTSSAGTATVYYTEGGAREFGNGPGGPNTRTRTFITSSETTEEIAQGTTETFTLETSQNPGILRDWPGEEDVPIGTEYDVQAIMFSLDSDSGGDVTLDNFRLQADEREFLARDSAFVDTDLAQYPNTDLTRIPFVFPESPTFSPGDELDIQVEATEGGTGDQDAVVDCTIVTYRRETGGA